MEEKYNNKSAMNVASLVLGIISIVTAAFWYVTIPTGILAVIFGAKSGIKNGSKIGKAGMITGIIGLSLFLFLYMSFILIILLESIYG